MHILGNPDNGYAVLTEDGWFHALKDLCCEKKEILFHKMHIKNIKDCIIH